MALTLISTWGGTGDTTYVLLDEADEYIGSNTLVGFKIDPTIWTELNSIQKARYLFAASRLVDNAENYLGERQFKDQTLEFPRIPSGDNNWPWVGRALTEVNTYNAYLTEQKRRVKNATIEQAYAFVRDGDRNEHIERRLSGIRGFSESVGPISESASYGGKVLPLCPEAMELLAPYINGSMELVRG